MTAIHSTDTTGLDAISPATHPGCDAAGCRALRAAAKNVEVAEQELRAAVLALSPLALRESPMMELVVPGILVCV